MTYSCDCYSLPLPPSQLTIPVPSSLFRLRWWRDNHTPSPSVSTLSPTNYYPWSSATFTYLRSCACYSLSLSTYLLLSSAYAGVVRNNHTLSPFVTTLSPNNYYPHNSATLTYLQSESCACYSLLSTYFLLSSAYAGDTRTLSPSVHSLIMITLAPQPTCILYNSYSLSLLLPFSLHGLRSDYATTPLHLQPNLPPTNYSSSSATVCTSTSCASSSLTLLTYILISSAYAADLTTAHRLRQTHPPTHSITVTQSTVTYVHSCACWSYSVSTKLFIRWQAFLVLFCLSARDNGLCGGLMVHRVRKRTDTVYEMKCTDKQLW